MTLEEQVYAQALLLAGELAEHQQQVLQTLCVTKVSILSSRLRKGLKPEDCKADFIAAASLLALADMNSISDEDRVEQITAGDFTIRKGSRDAASNCLRSQAELMIMPYLKDGFAFRGV